MSLDIKAIQWFIPGGEKISTQDLIKDIKHCSNLGCKIYVGSDSMLTQYKCNFAAVIAMHDRDLNIARYYYAKIKEPSPVYRELQVKILREAELAIVTAGFVKEKSPTSKIEIHIDIGVEDKNKTCKYFNAVEGWVKGAGFVLKVKPECWASSLADNHTKKEGTKKWRYL